MATAQHTKLVGLSVKNVNTLDSLKVLKSQSFAFSISFLLIQHFGTYDLPIVQYRIVQCFELADLSFARESIVGVRHVMFEIVNDCLCVLAVPASEGPLLGCRQWPINSFK